MARSVVVSLAFAGALLLATSTVALADKPGAGISVEPSEITAGQTVLLAGNDLEPDDERILVLQGESIVANLGTATTDGDGMLNQEIEVPGHLPSGVYQLQAIGDETLEVELRVTAAEGGAVGGDGGEAAIATRTRGTLELGVVLVGAALVAALGVLFVARAERVGGHAA